MVTVKRGWDVLSADERKTAVDDIINFFGQERDEEIGVFAAEDLLDMFLLSTSNHIYNKGVEDAKELMKKRIDDLDIELSALVKK